MTMIGTFRSIMSIAAEEDWNFDNMHVETAFLFIHPYCLSANPLKRQRSLL